jgi:glucose 1-dehydrogenase
MFKMRFREKVVVITGAGTGIGYEIARQLVIEGASVVLNDVNEKIANNATNTIISETNGKIISYVGNAGDVSFIYKMIDFTVETFGKIDFAVANAGITVFGNFLDFTEESFQKVVNLNLQGSFFLTQAFAKQVIKQGNGGKVLLMSSNIGYQAVASLSAYAMTKAAIKMIAKNLVAELSPLGICINAIAPGATLTERTALEEEDYWNSWSSVTPLNKIANTIDIAKTALFLLSDDANHITGQTILVDGGWSAMGTSPH